MAEDGLPNYPILICLSLALLTPAGAIVATWAILPLLHRHRRLAGAKTPGNVCPSVFQIPYQRFLYLDVMLANQHISVRHSLARL